MDGSEVVGAGVGTEAGKPKLAEANSGVKDRKHAGMMGTDPLYPIVKYGKKTQNDLAKEKTYRLVRAYRRGGIDRRSRIGKLITAWENEFVSMKGFARLSEAPITLKVKIQIAVGNLIFLATYEPQSDSVTRYRDIRAAENTLNRIMTELGLERRTKEVSLADYLSEHSKRESASAEG